MNDPIANDLMAKLRMIRAENVALRSNEGKKIANWTATIRDSNNVIQCRVNPKGRLEELTKGFDKVSAADNWCVLRLVEGASDWTAHVEHSIMNVSTTMDRDEAMARTFGKKLGPVTHSQKGSNGSLGFGAKVKETRVCFSRG